MKVCVEVTTDVEYDEKVFAEFMAKVCGAVAAKDEEKPSPDSVTIKVPTGDVSSSEAPSRKLDAMGLSFKQALVLVSVQRALCDATGICVARADTIRWLLDRISKQIWPDKKEPS